MTQGQAEKIWLASHSSWTLLLYALGKWTTNETPRLADLKRKTNIIWNHRAREILFYLNFCEEERRSFAVTNSFCTNF